MKSFDYLVLLFENYLKGLGYAKVTVRSNVYSINNFANYLRGRKKEDVRDVVNEDVVDFIKSYENKKTRLGRAFKNTTIFRIASSVRHFFKYLYRNEIILFNPIEELPIKKEITNKKEIFSQEEINNFLNSIDIECQERDRAIFELMYSSGLRIGEEKNLDMTDMDLRERILTIKQGKGSKDRYIPFSEVAKKFLQVYINGERKKQVKIVAREDKKALFLTTNGRIKDVSVRCIFKRILKDSCITRKGLTVHSIRHSTATHLLEAGADVRYVAELLGHEDIQTTVAYTHLMLDNLKKAYKSAHPRENKYYEEVDEEYLSQIVSLIKEMVRREGINKKYSPDKYNMRKKKNN